MSKKELHSVDCEFSVEQDGYTVKIVIKSDVPVFNYKNGAQVVLDAVADSAMQYYSLTQEDWDSMANKDSLDS